MENNNINAIYDLLDDIKITPENEQIIEEIREDLDMGNYIEALGKLKTITTDSKEDDEYQEDEEEYDKELEKQEGLYPNELCNAKLEHSYIGLLLSNPKLIMKYYLLYEECYFEDEMALNIYKSILFTEGSKYTPEKAKQGFNFAKETRRVSRIKSRVERRCNY